MSQTTSDILMIRPAHFAFNEETAGNNEFQTRDDRLEDAQKVAVKEFNAMTKLLRSKGVRVHVIQDTAEPIKPDAVFPNNWLSTHAVNTLITWPMYAFNRRTERREKIVAHLGSLFHIDQNIHYERYESEHIFLEGTGSLVFDRENKIAYACLSDRTHNALISVFCRDMGYTAIVFHALDEQQKSIYHTNVMMAIGEKVAVVCSEGILDESREKVLDSLRNSGKEILNINFDQMCHFAGNVIELKNTDGQSLMVLSKTAHRALQKEQLQLLEKHSELVVVDIPVIETIGGGSVRCMICEIFLEPRFS
mgnify:CR=1 FL=1